MTMAPIKARFTSSFEAPRRLKNNYSGDLKTDHLKTWRLHVRFSNGNKMTDLASTILRIKKKYFYLKWSKLAKTIRKPDMSTIKICTVGIWILNIWMPNFLKFGLQMIQYSNGWAIGYVLCTRPTIQIPEQNKTRWHPSNGWAVRYTTNLFLTIWIPD